jgi:type I restriction enzyme M protein
MNQDPFHAGAAPLQAYADLQAALEPGYGDDGWTWEWHNTLGSVAGLLITKWAGCGEALTLPRDDQPAVDHATALLGVLREVSSRLAVPLNVQPVKLPLMTLAETRPETYKAIVAWSRGIDLDSSDGRQVAAGAFDAAVRVAVHHNGRHAGEYITPSRVADLMLDLVKPKPSDKIYDPCFGFGGLLVGAARRTGAMDSSSTANSSIQRASIFGIEIGPAQYAIGLCRLLLSDVPAHGLVYDDALDGPFPDEHPAEGFDCILMVPPWGRWSGGSESQFLQHVMSRLRPGGRAVVATSEGTLYRPGLDQRVRKALLSEFNVEAVIALPRGAFVPYTSIPGSLVLFSRSEPQATVCFATVSSAAWEAAAPEERGDDRVRTSSALTRAAIAGAVIGSVIPVMGTVVGGVIGGIAALLGSGSRKCPTDVGVPGIETWKVSVRELAQRRHELIAKKSGSDVLESEMERLVAACATLRIERLQSVAEVYTGVPYDRSVSTEHRSAPDTAAGLIRVGDVTDNEVRAPSLFFTGNANAQTLDKALLRFSDVVVTMSGTVGKVGVITDDATSVGALATKGMAVIRTRAGIRPQFVAALLRSPTYQNWLSGHARGLAIQHLSIRVLRTLRIPVPPEDIQNAILLELAGPGVDTLAVLLRLLSGTAHPVTAWLETPHAARLAAGASDDQGGLGTLAAIGAELQSTVMPAGFEADDSNTADRSSSAWLAIVRKAAGALQDILSIPRGSGRLAVLEFAAARFHEAIRVLDPLDEALSSQRLRSVTEAMAKLAEQEVHNMQRTVHLKVDVSPTEVATGVATEVGLRVTNTSAVPLLHVRVTAEHSDGTIDADEVVYLAEGQNHEIPLVVQPKEETQPVHIAVAWQARRLDSKVVRGETVVSLLVRSSDEDGGQGDLGASPYIVGSPVDRDAMFFGRAGLMDQIRRQLGGSDRANVILLEGNRRTGKTSILRQLAKEDTLPGWVVVYCSFQDVDSMSTCDVFRLLVLRTGWALFDHGIETWIPDLPRPDSNKRFKLAFRSSLSRAFADRHPFETLELYLETAIEAASPRGVLLMLDEFDKLQEGIDDGITSPQVPENLRHLLQHQPGLGAIITGSRRLKRLREDYWSALFGIGYRIGVSALQKADAGRLVTEPVAGRLRYLPQACDGIVELCACHPFLIQSLCSRVFDEAVTASDRTITLEVVERAATEMVRDNEHFQTLWGYAGSERRRLILALCDRLADGPDAVNIDFLRIMLEGSRVPVRRDRELADDVAELRELEMLDLDKSYRGGSYRLSIPLMANWLRINVAFDDLVVRAREEAEISS